MKIAEFTSIGMCLHPGETIREVCPHCKGGTTKEESFVIGRTETGKIFLKCHRASCGYTQLLNIGKNGIVIENRQKPQSGPPYQGELLKLPQPVLDHFAVQYGLSGDECYFQGWRWATHSERVYMPVWNDCRHVRGYGLRSIEEKANPKFVLNRINYDEPLIHWADSYSMRGSTYEFCDDLVVIVEDHISAAKAAPVVQTVALCGHFLDYDRIIDIAAQFDHAVLALDNDCFGKSIVYLNKFKDLFKSMKVWKLEQDLKYVSRERILRAIKNGKTDFSELS